MDRKKYRWCAVPKCGNTSVTAPNKIFIDIPRKPDIRKQWFDLARRNFYGMSVTSPRYFCEDHFNLPEDMENYMRYHVMGFVHKVMLKPGSLPSRFHCQTDGKEELESRSLSPPANKKQRLTIKQEILDSQEESNTSDDIIPCDCVIKDENESMPLDAPTDNEVEEQQQPKYKDKCIQVPIKTKTFRSKQTQTTNNTVDTGTSP